MTNKLNSRTCKIIVILFAVGIFIYFINPFSIVKAKYIWLYKQNMQEFGESYVWEHYGDTLYLGTVDDQDKVIKMIQRAKPVWLIFEMNTTNRSILLGKYRLILSADYINLSDQSGKLFKLTYKDYIEIDRMINSLPHSKKEPKSIAHP